MKTGTDWNQNHGVGVTLLENWVEERAVGDKILEERESGNENLSKHGHQDILYSAKDVEKLPESSSQTAFSIQQFSQDPNLNQTGVRKRLRDFGLLERAIRELHEPLEDRSGKYWKSIYKTTMGDGSGVQDLWKAPPSKDEMEKYKFATTLYSFKKGKDGDDCRHHGKNSFFSTPIQYDLNESRIL